MDFSAIADRMDRALAQGRVPFSEIAISYRGEPVYRYRNGGLTGSELYYLYSCTKPITATAVLQLHQQGKLGLDDPVAGYLPEFAELQVKTPDGLAPVSAAMTIRHLLTMTSGLNYDCLSPSILAQQKANPHSTTRELVAAMARQPLDFQPGSRYQYSLSHDVLGAVIEAVSGMPLGEYMEKHIFAPCGMTRTGFSLPPTGKEGLCQQYFYDEALRQVPRDNGFVLSPVYQSGGAGLISCVDDYFAFVTELANGEKLLNRETLALLRSPQLSGTPLADFRQSKGEYNYGLGVRTATGTNLPNQGEFGWDGAAGAYCLVDPERHLAVFYATHVLNAGDYFEKHIRNALRDDAYQAIEKGADAL